MSKNETELELVKLASALCDKIENLPASTTQTEASIMASELRLRLFKVNIKNKGGEGE